jgi:photosynthetic reaction center cytochrome c subunit
VLKKSVPAMAAGLVLTATLAAAPQQQTPPERPQAQAQAPRWTWPENPTNLKVLPKDMGGQRLQPVMVGFSNALGVRCTHCHKGVEGSPLSTYDFASDENPNKDRAREMLRMLKDINTDLEKIQPSGDKRVNMWCNTCHNGRARPMTLGDELGEQYRKNGIEAALERYADLKQRYYGKAAYDFSENALNAFGYTVLESDAPGAIEVFKLNAFEYPQSSNVWDSLAEAYMKFGDKASAQRYYEKAIARDPNAENAKQMLKKIKESQGK